MTGKPSFQTNVWCYLWDLVDEGIGEALDRLKGEAGATGISVATCYHRVDELRPHPGVVPRRFRSAGGAQFQPNGSHYPATRMRPVVAEWLRKSNPLAELGEACVKRGLTLRGWNVCTHSSVTAARYPAHTTKDVVGVASPTWLCPSNPDVREYLRSMVDDLSRNYPFEAIELERPTFPTDLHAHSHDKVGFPCGLSGEWLQSLCFCESCRQVAQRDGIDVGSAAAVVARSLEKMLTYGQPLAQTISELVDAEPVLAAYAAWRRDQITLLIKLIKSSCSCRLVVQRSGCPYWAATDFTRIAQFCDAFLVVFYNPDLSKMNEVVRAAAGEMGGIERVEIGLNACSPPCTSADTLVASMKRAVELGVRSANIYNYGMLPLNRLEWIRQATRYARREA